MAHFQPVDDSDIYPCMHSYNHRNFRECLDRYSSGLENKDVPSAQTTEGQAR